MTHPHIVQIYFLGFGHQYTIIITTITQIVDFSKRYKSNEGVGFFPGQASLAYTFFLGPAGTFGIFIATDGAFSTGATTGAMSTSGARFGACMNPRVLLPMVPNAGDVGVVGEVGSFVFGKSEYNDGL